VLAVQASTCAGPASSLVFAARQPPDGSLFQYTRPAVVSVCQACCCISVPRPAVVSVCHGLLLYQCATACFVNLLPTLVNTICMCFLKTDTAAQAQRLGRILRAKQGKTGYNPDGSLEFNAFFYTLVGAHNFPCFQCFAVAHKKRLFSRLWWPPVATKATQVLLCPAGSSVSCRSFCVLQVLLCPAGPSVSCRSFCVLQVLLCPAGQWLVPLGLCGPSDDGPCARISLAKNADPELKDTCMHLACPQALLPASRITRCRRIHHSSQAQLLISSFAETANTQGHCLTQLPPKSPLPAALPGCRSALTHRRCTTAQSANSSWWTRATPSRCLAGLSESCPCIELLTAIL